MWWAHAVQTHAVQGPTVYWHIYVCPSQSIKSINCIVADCMRFRAFLEQGWESRTPWTPVSWDYTRSLTRFKAHLSPRCIPFVSRQVTAFLPGQHLADNVLWTHLTLLSLFPMDCGDVSCLTLRQPLKTQVQGNHVDVLHPISGSAGRARHTYTAQKRFFRDRIFKKIKEPLRSFHSDLWYHS